MAIFLAWIFLGLSSVLFLPVAEAQQTAKSTKKNNEIVIKANFLKKINTSSLLENKIELAKTHEIEKLKILEKLSNWNECIKHSREIEKKYAELSNWALSIRWSCLSGAAQNKAEFPLKSWQQEWDALLQQQDFTLLLRSELYHIRARDFLEDFITYKILQCEQCEKQLDSFLNSKSIWLSKLEISNIYKVWGDVHRAKGNTQLAMDLFKKGLSFSENRFLVSRLSKMGETNWLKENKWHKEQDWHQTLVSRFDAEKFSSICSDDVTEEDDIDSLWLKASSCHLSAQYTKAVELYDMALAKEESKYTNSRMKAKLIFRKSIVHMRLNQTNEALLGFQSVLDRKTSGDEIAIAANYWSYKILKHLESASLAKQNKKTTDLKSEADINVAEKITDTAITNNETRVQSYLQERQSAQAKTSQDFLNTLWNQYPLSSYSIFLLNEQNKQNKKNMPWDQYFKGEKLSKLTSVLPGSAKKTLDRIQLLAKHSWLEEAAEEVHLLDWPTDDKSQILKASLLLDLNQFLVAFRSLDKIWSEKPQVYHEISLVKKIFPILYRDLIQKYVEKNSLQVADVLGLIRQESSFRSHIVSPAGAHGLSQMMLPTAKDIAKKMRLKLNYPQDLYIPENNIKMGIRYKEELFKKYESSWPLILASYNVGMGNIRNFLKQRSASLIDTELNVIDRLNGKLDQGPEYLQDLWVEELPWDETRQYVKTVQRNRVFYRLLYPEL